MICQYHVLIHNKTPIFMFPDFVVTLCIQNPVISHHFRFLPPVLSCRFPCQDFCGSFLPGLPASALAPRQHHLNTTIGAILLKPKTQIRSCNSPVQNLPLAPIWLRIRPQPAGPSVFWLLSSIWPPAWLLSSSLISSLLPPLALHLEVPVPANAISAGSHQHGSLTLFWT